MVIPDFSKISMITLHVLKAPYKIIVNLVISVKTFPWVTWVVEFMPSEAGDFF